jgi:plasmid maintenance system antidote protein VapI
MKAKEQMHPGKILKIIMHDIFPSAISVGIPPLEAIHNMSYIPESDLEKLFNGELDIDYPIAFRLGKSMKGTDMAFWLKLQKDYDDYIESSIEKDIDESISQLEERYDENLILFIQDFFRLFFYLQTSERFFREEDKDFNFLAAYKCVSKGLNDLDKIIKKLGFEFYGEFEKVSDEMRERSYNLTLKKQ